MPANGVVGAQAAKSHKLDPEDSTTASNKATNLNLEFTTIARINNPTHKNM